VLQRGPARRMMAMLTDIQAAMVDGLRDYEEIGHGLARICRFGGRIRGYYPVLAHTFVVEALVAPQQRIYALLHDAAEVLTGDQCRPFKTRAATALEEEIIARLLAGMGIAPPDKATRKAVVWADEMAVAAEWRVLAPLHPDEWPSPPTPSATALRETRRWAQVPLRMWLNEAASRLYAEHCARATAEGGCATQTTA